MTLLAMSYVLLLAGRAWTLIQDSNPIAVLMGLGMAVFPLVAIWAIYKEIRFGLASEQLVKRAIAEGVTELELELRPSGRATKDSAQRAFESVKDSFDETSWSSWLLLSEAYEASGDRKRARQAMRKALLIADQTQSS
jgi:hypothetical protein